ncbi:MAG: SPASM domain-containing protein, partial [Armatimonadetes bacterium]|nr:SPASM domain-containing protein [Armatimonadota bacterium]
VYPSFNLGNLLNQPLGDMVNSEQQVEFGNDKRDTLPKYCRECEVRFACNGECPKHRFLKTPEGEPGLNYLCAGYKRFFNHVDPNMRAMAQLLEAQRAPAEVMGILARQERQQGNREATKPSPGKVGRNEPCPCGSGQKFKKCCGAAAAIE